MVQLYWFTISGTSRKAMMCLEEAGETYQATALDFRNGEHKQPDYLAINPNGRIPAIAGKYVACASVPRSAAAEVGLCCNRIRAGPTHLIAVWWLLAVGYRVSTLRS